MMGSPKIYGFGVAVICAVIAAVHAPGLTHHSALEGYVHLGHSCCRHSDARFRVSPGQGVTPRG